MSTAIEHYLKIRPQWVKGSELEMVFHVNERELRATADRPGLCSAFAISGNLGYKHYTHATPEEMTAFLGRLRAHSQTQKDRANQLEAAYEAHLNRAAPPPAPAPVGIVDKTGQGLLLA